MQFDLVDHNGGCARIKYCQPPDVTDRCSSWTETQTTPNKVHYWVFPALRDIRGQFLFLLIGIHLDNGPEPINARCVTTAKRIGLGPAAHDRIRRTATAIRSRSGATCSRGYLPYETKRQLLLNQLCLVLLPYTNLFQPMLRLAGKVRVGSEVRRRYDGAETRSATAGLIGTRFGGQAPTGEGVPRVEPGRAEARE